MQITAYDMASAELSLSAGALCFPRANNHSDFTGGTSGRLLPTGPCPDLDLPHPARPCRLNEWDETSGRLLPTEPCPDLDLPHPARPCRPSEWAGTSGRLRPNGPCLGSEWRHHGSLYRLRESSVSPLAGSHFVDCPLSVGGAQLTAIKLTPFPLR